MRDARTQDVIANQSRFFAKQGIIFQAEELVRMRIEAASVAVVAALCALLGSRDAPSAGLSSQALRSPLAPESP